MKRKCVGAKLLQVVLAVALLACGGCKSLRKGVLAPRSGELFQTTRMGIGDTTIKVASIPESGAAMCMAGMPVLGIPCMIATLPVSCAAIGLDMLVISPLTDVLCLPYDLCLPNRGFYYRLVDPDGKPLAGVRVGVWFFDFGMCGLDLNGIAGKTDEAGEFYVNRLHKVTSSFTIFAEGYERVSGLDQKDDPSKVKPSEDGRIVITCVAKRKP